MVHRLWVACGIEATVKKWPSLPDFTLVLFIFKSILKLTFKFHHKMRCFWKSMYVEKMRVNVPKQTLSLLPGPAYNSPRPRRRYWMRLLSTPLFSSWLKANGDGQTQRDWGQMYTNITVEWIKIALIAFQCNVSVTFVDCRINSICNCACHSGHILCFSAYTVYIYISKAFSSRKMNEKKLWYLVLRFFQWECPSSYFINTTCIWLTNHGCTVSLFVIMAVLFLCGWNLLIWSVFF